MADDATLTVTISREDAEAISLAVGNGYYDSGQEAVADALATWRERQAAFDRDLKPFLEERLRRGREDLEAGRCRSVEEVFAELRAELETQISDESIS